MNVESARNAAEFTNSLKTDSRGRVTAGLVPGHNGKLYDVLLTRSKKDGVQIISTQCTCRNDKTPCKGNANQLCYHSLAAILAGAAKNKVRVAFCKTRESADKLSNIGGATCIVHSAQSQKEVWMSAKDLLEATMVC